MASIQTIKAKIVEKLTEMTQEVTPKLKAVTALDIRKDPLDGKVTKYPHAFVMPPSIDSARFLDNRSEIREYTFAIMVVCKADNISSTSEVEELMEAMMDKFNNSVTLDNELVGGMKRTTSTPATISHGSVSYVVFDILLTGQAVYDLVWS